MSRMTLQEHEALRAQVAQLREALEYLYRHELFMVDKSKEIVESVLRATEP